VRIVSTLLFAGFISTIVVPTDGPELEIEGVSDPEVSLVSEGIDPIVTGIEISDEHKANWKKMRDEYVRCPKCLESQPFPGD
jgi:hypothetical protein